MRRKTSSGWFLIVLMAGMCSPSWAKDWFVDAAWPNSEVDSPVETTFPSIQEALRQAIPGDTIWVAPGRYMGPIQMKDGVHLRGSGAHSTFLRGGGGRAVVTGANHCRIEGFAIQGDEELDIDGVLCEKVNGFVISRNVIAHHTWSGVAISESTVVLAGNLIISNRCAGIWCRGQSSSPVQILHNTISGNHNEAGINLWDGASAEIINNVIAGNTGYGGIYCYDHGTARLERNNVWGNSCILGPSTNYVGCSPGPTDISVDPRFVNGPGQDFRLRHDSACLDAGIAVHPDWTEYLRIDLNGISRLPSDPGTVLVKPDLGAFETAPLAIARVEVRSNQEVNLRWASLPGEIYSIQASPMPGNSDWAEIGQAIALDELTSWTGPQATAAAQFFRIAIMSQSAN